MKNRWLLPVSGFIFLFCISNPSAHSDQIKVKKDLHPARPAVASDEILVRFKDAFSEQDAEKKSHGRATSSGMIGKTRVHKLKVKKGYSAEEMLKQFKADPSVDYAELDQPVEAHFVPNDPLYRRQWNFDDAQGAPNPYGGTNGGGINLEPAWDIRQGDKSVIVAVIDTGVAYEDFGTFHKAPDLANTEFVAGYDFVNGDTHPNDDNGHGTHVSGTIAQSTNNGTGVAGIAFKTSIMPIKVLDNTGRGFSFNVANGIIYAADHGAKVINLSLGASSPSQTMEDAAAYAYSKGVSVVASAGNNSGAVSYPAAYDAYVIAVSATRYDETLTWYSNFGPQIDVAAPGGDTNVDQDADGYPDGILQQTFGADPAVFNYYFYQGTSMAAPHVSGVAALLISGGVDTPDKVRQAIENSAEDKGAPGRDNFFGAGLLDARAALDYAGVKPGSDVVLSWRLENSAADDTTLHPGIPAGGMIFSNAAAPTPFQNDYSARFDGVDDFLKATASTDMNTFPVSVLFWFKTQFSGTKADLAGKYTPAGSNGYLIHMNSGKIYAWYFKNSNNFVWDGALGLNGGVVNDGRWHHAAFTVDASGGKLYVDGLLKSSRAWSGSPGPATTLADFQIGGGNNFFPGDIDEVKVINRALGVAEIAALAANTNLIHYLKWDNNSEDSVSPFPATLYGPVYSTQHAPSVFVNSHALVLNGVSDYAYIPYTSSLNAYPMTLACWVKTSQLGKDAGIINKYYSYSYNGYQIFLNAGSVYAFYIKDRTNYVWDKARGLSGGVINDDRWHHIAFTVDASGGKIYVDGVMKSSMPWTGVPGPVSNFPGMRFGRFMDSFFKGSIDDARLYKRALDPSEVADLARVAPPVTQTASAVSSDQVTQTPPPAPVSGGAAPAV